MKTTDYYAALGMALAIMPFVFLAFAQGGTGINYPLTFAGVVSFVAGTYMFVSSKTMKEQTTHPNEANGGN